MPQHHRHAFTLIELSIVLVIVGLVISGILSGKSLIKSAELRSVMTDTNNYLSAVSSFRDQYRYLPGDMPTAARYWTTVSGNGDGQVLTTERFRLWQQLNLAGMVEKSYTGISGPGGGGTDDFVIDGNSVNNNVPESRIKQTGFSFYYLAANGNMLTYGASVTAGGGPPTDPALTSTDAATIDKKADDGIPNSGKWIGNGTGCTGTTYTGSNTAVICSFFIKSGF